MMGILSINKKYNLPNGENIISKIPINAIGFNFEYSHKIYGENL
jgi:hypothetical protein